MLIFYIRAVALFEIAFAITQLVFRDSAMWLMIIEPRAGLSALDLFFFGGYGLPDLLPTATAIVLLISARRIVGSVNGLLAYIAFEAVYFLGWGTLLVLMGIQPNFDGSPWSITSVINYTTVTWFVASAVPLFLATQSLLRLRRSLAPSQA